MKRVICIVLVSIMLIIPFAVTAFAGVEDTLIGFFIDWFVGTSIDVGYGDRSADEIIDFYNSPAGRVYLDVFDYGSTPGMFVDLHEYVDTANGKRAWAMKTNADGIQSLYDTANGFMTWRDTEIRHTDFETLGLTTYSEIKGGCYLSGSGNVCQLLQSNDDWDNGGQYINLPDGYDDKSVYVFNGNSLSFPAIYVGSNADLYQSGKRLPSNNWYIPISGSELLCVAGCPNIKSGYTVGDTVTDVVSYFICTSPSYAGRWTNCWIFYRGSHISEMNTSSYIGYDIIDILEKMVGMHIDTATDDGSSSSSFTVPENIPYDDNGDVVISIPYGGGAPTYISYNDYINNIDNGTYNTDNSINYGDYYDDSVANTIINNYNNYNSVTNGSSFDDTNILNRLDKIIDKLNVLDDIKKKLNDISKAIKDLEYPEVEPCYENFSDCITTNIPLIGAIKDSIGSMDETVASNPSNAGFDFNVESSSSSKLPVLSGSSGSWTDKIRVNIDMSWYGPYADDIRNVLKLGVYVCGLYGIWRSVLSVFGIRTL